MYNGDNDNGLYLDQYIEQLLLEKFNIDKDGVFVDVGAYHPTYLSNSYYFEQNKNFTVICVEANPIMAELLRTVRKNVVESAASDKSGDIVDFQVVSGQWDNHGFGGSVLEVKQLLRTLLK